jgi:transposase
VIWRTRSGGGWSRTCRPRSPGRGTRTRRIGASSMAFSGSCAPARLGAICRRAMARSGQCRAAFIAGAPRACGTGSWRRCRPRRRRLARSTGTYTMWMRQSSAPISTPPAPAETALSGVRRRPGRRWAAARAASRPSCTCGPKATIALEALLDGGAIRRPGRGRPRLRPRRAAGDKGYSSPTARRRLRRRHIRAVIPSKSNQRRQPNFDRAAYRRRNLVERLINRLKQFRRIATRYDKRALNYLAMVHIGMLLLWL